MDISATGGQDYDDGYDRVYCDAHRDFRGLNGHGFDDSVNHGISDTSYDMSGVCDGWAYAQQGNVKPVKLL